jgi:peptide/nickel transport system permease protein
MFLTVFSLIVRRFLIALPILVIVSALLFAALRLIPVDPAAMSMPATATNEEIAAKRIEMGLDKPLPVQYAYWLSNIASGDFGDSIHYRRPVIGLIGAALPQTIELAGLAMVIASIFGMAGGLLMFYFRGRVVASAIDFASIVLLSLPDFLWGLFFILVFGVVLDVLPFTGRLSSGIQQPVVTGFLLLDALIRGEPYVAWDALRHMLLPAFALGLAFSPTIMRVLNSSLLDVYQEDFIQQARLRGVSERRILTRHALKNAVLPTLTLMGVQFGFLFGGTLLIEVIYSYPGIGNLMIGAVRDADLPMIQILGLTYCVAVLLISAIVDAMTLILNPKLRTPR